MRAPRPAAMAMRRARRRSARPSVPPATRPSASSWSAALHEVGGVVTELAKRYDMNRSHVQTLLKKHGIRSKDCRNGNMPRH